jgi:hypothetical protein
MTTAVLLTKVSSPMWGAHLKGSAVSHYWSWKVIPGNSYGFYIEWDAPCGINRRDWVERNDVGKLRVWEGQPRCKHCEEALTKWFRSMSRPSRLDLLMGPDE